MAEEQLRGVIDGIRAKLQAELDNLNSLALTHEQALLQTRQRAEADADERWSSKLEAIHAQWGSRLESEVASARADVERTLADAVARARSEAEQAASEAAAHARRELDDAIATERARAQADLERAQADRERAQADLQRAQADLERAQSDRERAQADRQTAHDELQRAQTERERTQEELQRAQAEHARTQEELQRAQSERERTHQDLQRAQTERERTQQELQRAQTDREQTQQHLQRAHADHQRAQEDLQRAQAERARAQEELQQARGDRERAQGDLQRAHEERERAQQDLQRAHEALERAQQQLQDAQAQAESIRQQASRELEETRQQHAVERASAADALANARQAAESMPRDASALLISLQAIDEASTLTEALAAAVRGAALESPRAALFVIDGSTLHEWPVEGVPPVDSGPIRAQGREAGFLAEVLRTGETVSMDGTNGHAAPMFAGLPSGRRAIAVPFVLDGRPVAVLYADEGTDGQPLASWLETVQILGRHATSVVASLTAIRTAQAMRFLARGSAAADHESIVDGAALSEAAHDDAEQSARRYAKLLVSEIKLYNEGAVRVGRERRDLASRLRDEITRARQLYDERVGSDVADRARYFQQELVQTLADGDPSLFQ